MELALPILALGSLYIVSNKMGKKDKPFLNENFENMGESRSNVINAPLDPQRYPKPSKQEIENNINKYQNPNDATSTYFNQNVYEKMEEAGVNVGKNLPQVYSLSGNYMDTDEFRHNNMKPFYGGKVKGQLYNDNISETLLDNMVGSSSQTTRKLEQAPLFKPEENINYSFGAPNQSDFYQSRVVPGNKNNMVKPFETVTVAPGLNQGYGTEGSNGYNSGMEARDLWLDRTVDELRVKTNPKQEYSLDGLEGPAECITKNLGSIGRVEKYTPDSFFINTQDRWLTTLGAARAGQLQPHQAVKETDRNDTTREYQGVASNPSTRASYIPGVYRDAHRSELGPKGVNCSSAVGNGPLEKTYYIGSYDNPNNARSMNNQVDSFRSSFSNAIGAVIAPLTDILRPTKKAETCTGVVVLRGAKGGVASNYVIDPNSTPKTTNKETNIYSSYGFVGNQVDSTYISNERPVYNQRDTTTVPGFLGGAGGLGNNYGEKNYEMYKNQTNNENKQTMEWTNIGNINIFNPSNNYSLNRSDTETHIDNRSGAPKNIIGVPPSVDTFGKTYVPQSRNNSIGCKQIDPSILDAFRQNPYTFSLTNTA